MNFLKNYSTTLLLLLGIILGGISGILFGEKASIVKPIGDMFLNLIFVLIVPLVFFSISSAVCNMKQGNMIIGKVIGNIIFVFLSTAIFAGIISYIVLKVYNPFEGLDYSRFSTGLEHIDINSSKDVTASMFVTTLTVSDFSSLLTKSNLLPLIIFSIIFGLATAMAKETKVSAFLNSVTRIILKMMTIIMYVAPIGLGCYFADVVGNIGSDILTNYIHVFAVYLILTLISYVGLNTVYAFLSGGKNGCFAFWKNILTPSLTAIATSSSAACIPINIETSKKIGVPADIAETVIPLGTNINKGGSVMGGIIKIVFLLTIFSQSSENVSVFAILGVALLVGIVMGAIPGGGMTGEILICSVFGFDPALAGVLMIISTIIDIPATLLNSIGNVSCSMLVTRLTEGNVWNKKIKEV